MTICHLAARLRLFRQHSYCALLVIHNLPLYRVQCQQNGQINSEGGVYSSTNTEPEVLLIVSSANRRFLSTLTGCSTTDDQVNAVCITRTFVYACWLLSDFSDQCEGIARYFYRNTYYLYRANLYNAGSHKDATIEL